MKKPEIVNDLLELLRYVGYLENRVDQLEKENEKLKTKVEVILEAHGKSDEDFIKVFSRGL